VSDFAEVKALFEKEQATVQALRDEVKSLEGKQRDYIDTDRLAKAQADLAAQITAMEAKQAARMDDLESAMNRPGAPAGGGKADGYKAAFGDYLRKGYEADELKAMSTQSAPDGGFMVADGMEAGIRDRIRRTSPVRQVASVVSFSGGVYQVLTERGDAGYEWAGERESRSETTTPTINRINITAHELSALPKVSQRLLDTADYDVEGWLTGYVADVFARAEATAFVSGNGQDKPKGFLSYATSDAADDARANETIQYRATGASGAFNGTDPANVLVQTFYDLQGAYQANATWMAKNTTAAAIATLKGGDGAYLVQSMLNTDGSMVRTIMGRPLAIADDMPAIGANSLSIAVGDFGRGYTIVDGKAVTVLRDPFSAKPNVLFYTTKRVGGGVTEFDAIKLIKFGTS
jgi:HK97 family phage major capsid protein